MSERTRSYDVREIGDFMLYTGDAAEEAYLTCNDCIVQTNTDKEPSCSFAGTCNDATRSCKCKKGKISAHYSDEMHVPLF